MFNVLSWDGEFGALLPERLRGGHLGGVASLDISTYLTNKQGSVDVDGPNAYLNHGNDSVVLRNNVEGSVADFNIKVLSRIYKKKAFTNNKGDLLKTETDRIDPISLKYNETYAVTNKEGVYDPGLSSDKIRDTDITISLVRVTTVEKDITGNVVKDPVTGLPKLITTDAAGGTGVTDLPTENLKEYLMYGGVLVAVIVVGYGAYWYLSRQPKGASK